jgi:hypothetical protein
VPDGRCRPGVNPAVDPGGPPPRRSRQAAAIQPAGSPTTQALNALALRASGATSHPPRYPGPSRPIPEFGRRYCPEPLDRTRTRPCSYPSRWGAFQGLGRPMVPPPPRPPTAFVITRGRCPGPYTRLLLTEVTGRSERRRDGDTAKGQGSVRETTAQRNRAHGQDSARSFRSSAAPPRSRRKSSPAASVSSLTRTSTKPVLPDSGTVLDEKLELALLRKSMSGSAGPCSPELLSCGHRAVKAGSTGMGSAVDSTLDDHGSTENAHTPAAMRGLAIKSKQTGNRTDPGDLALARAAVTARLGGWR